MVVYFSDIHIYLTEEATYRAYVIQAPHLEAWGGDKRAAVNNLVKILAVKEIPFDVGDAPWFVEV